MEILSLSHRLRNNGIFKLLFYIILTPPLHKLLRVNSVFLSSTCKTCPAKDDMNFRINLACSESSTQNLTVTENSGFECGDTQFCSSAENCYFCKGLSEIPFKNARSENFWKVASRRLLRMTRAFEIRMVLIWPGSITFENFAFPLFGSPLCENSRVSKTGPILYQRIALSMLSNVVKDLF